MGCVILCVQNVLPSRVLLLEGQDGQTCKDHVHNCVMYHLFYLNGQIFFGSCFHWIALYVMWVMSWTINYERCF